MQMSILVYFKIKKEQMISFSQNDDSENKVKT